MVNDEEIPSTGATVTRSWQLARTAEGGMVVWVGRRKSAGRPRRSPGLLFDTVVTGDSTADRDPLAPTRSRPPA